MNGVVAALAKVKQCAVRASPALGSWFDAIRVLRGQLIVALLAAAVFILPDQIHELYLVIAQDLATSLLSPWTIFSVARFFLSIGLIGFWLWHTARRQIVRSQEHRRRATAGPSAGLLRLLCILVCALPFIAVAIGFLYARASIPGATVTPDAPEIGALRNSYCALVAVSLVLGLMQAVLLERWNARAPLFDPAKRTHRWMTAAIVVAIVLGLWAEVAQIFGPIVILALFFIALTYLVSEFTLAFDNYHLPVITCLVIAAAVFSWLGINDNHRFRTASDLAPEQQRANKYERTTVQSAFAGAMQEIG